MSFLDNNPKINAAIKFINFEEKWVVDYNARLSVCFRYIEDIFCSFALLDNKNTAPQFLHYLNNCHANIINQCLSH